METEPVMTRKLPEEKSGRAVPPMRAPHQPALMAGATASGWVPCEAPQADRQALTAFMKRSRMTTGSIVITGIFALPLSHLQTMIVISPESSAS